MTYACRDCDTTFTAPTDTDTVRCPGCGDMVEQQPAESSPPPDQTLRDRIADALEQADYRPDMRRGDLADAIMPVLHGLTLRELEQLARPNTPPSRPELRLPDHTVNEAEAPAPVKQRADCTELEWAQQERARFERLYTRETVRADLAEQRADTAARDADIYQQRLERLGEGYTRERKRADEAEAHRLALSEALGLGTGAPWDAIHDRATELGLPPLTEDPVAQRLGLVPEPADRAAVLSEAADAVFALNYDDLVSEQDDENLGSMREAWDLGTIHATQLLRRLAAEAQPELEADPQPVSEEFLQHLATAKVREDDGAEAPQPEEEAELVCVDECGSCDACGMEPFGTPAEGWREAARFLRRTPRDSTDFSGALRGARLIEDELRRRAEAQQPDTETRTSWTPGPVALARAVEWATKRQDATVDPAMCPRCKGDNREAFALCPACAQAAAAGPGRAADTQDDEEA